MDTEYRNTFDKYFCKGEDRNREVADEEKIF